MATRESVALDGNLTLTVVDVNPQSGLVWLQLDEGNRTHVTEITRAGQVLTCREKGLNLMVTRIYAGGAKDLVVLKVAFGDEAGNTVSNTTGMHPQDQSHMQKEEASDKAFLLLVGLVTLFSLAVVGWSIQRARR